MSAGVETAVLVTAVLLGVTRQAIRRRLAKRRASGIPLRSHRKRTVVLVVAGLLGLQVMIGTPAFADQCGVAPLPESPGSGMVGAVDPPTADHPGPTGPDGRTINYGKYNYAGVVWHAYQDNCVLAQTITDPNSVIDTWAGNELFNIGKNIVGATNSLHYAMLSPDGLLGSLDNAVQAAAKTFYNNIYLRWFGPVALILAIMLFRYIWTGNLARIGKRTMWALAGMWLAASVLALGPLYSQVDSLLLQKTSQIQAGFLPSGQQVTQDDALPISLYDHVIYNNWLRGEFGDPTSPQAAQYGPELLSDQAWATDQRASAGDPAQVSAKQNDYKSLPSKLGPAAGYFEGTEGSRTGVGFLAALQAMAYALFQLFAKAAVLLAQVLLRILMLAAPLIGLAAMVMEDLLPRIARAAGAVLFNVLLLSALAGVHALLLNLIFGAPQLSLFAQTMLAGLATIVFFMVGRPLRRIWQMVEMSVAAAGAGIPSAPSMFRRKRSTEPTAQESFWRGVRDADTGPGAADGPRIRPEATIPEQASGPAVRATAQRMDRPGGRRPLPGSIDADGAPALAPAGPRGYGGPTITVPEAGASRLVDSPSVVDRGWDRTNDLFVVPSQVSRPESVGAGPRRAEAEMVSGRPVYVLYRPSRGLEVRDSGGPA
ncbi:MAG TPA: hypothetical protein VG317_14475 [Pseudonocardiaceae bacterium]|nr:hypothetical protein [Pseudonocardiaceae bacterium]